MENGTGEGNGREEIPSLKYVFGAQFLIANKLQTMLDREFKGFGMTAKQWLLSIVVDNLFDSPPTLKETAAAMGSTHQNVKQVALKMQRNGFMEIRGDERDGRALRLELTEKNRQLWEDMQERGDRFMSEVYKGLSEDEMEALSKALDVVWTNVMEMDHRYMREDD